MTCKYVEETAAMRELVDSPRYRPLHNIIATSPWMAEPGFEPHRIVIRDVMGDFVVHSQAISQNGAGTYFCNGDYYPKERQNALALAWRRFNERTARMMGIATC